MEILESNKNKRIFLSELMGHMEDYYTYMKENAEFELFMGALAMLLERRCVEEGKDLTETANRLLAAITMVNETEGPTQWYSE